MTDFNLGLTQFNSGAYHRAHEIWEDLWRGAQGDEKLFLQALIQLAVGLYHHERGKPQAGVRMAGKALQRLEKLPENHEGWDFSSLRKCLDSWMEQGRPPDEIRNLSSFLDTQI